MSFFLDNFLFQQMISQEETGEEFVRILFGTILGKSVHKVKMDVGVGYEELKDVVIIIILPYDPFDKNRMVYTIQNQCVEAPDVVYEDGAKKIFLYTRGTEGNPSQELKDMLKYIEKTTSDNVVNQAIETINSLVNKVKQNREVGINYMKSWEYEQMIKEEAKREGLEQGRELGLEQGFERGGLQGLVSLICKKLSKGFTVSQIAELVEEDETRVTEICQIAEAFAPDYDVVAIVERLQN